MIGKHAWQAQILDVIRYVLLLQHPSDLEEVTSRENANLLTIKTGTIVQRKSLAEVSGVLAQGSARTLTMNSMKPMLCNTKQTNKQKQPVPPPPTPTPHPPLSLANPPRVRSYLAHATAGRVQYSTRQ